MNLLKGLYGMIRNPLAHNFRIEWDMTEQDALDSLTTIRPVRIRAKLPSTCKVSSFRSIRSTSSAGTGDSSTQILEPRTLVWNRPSPPNRADETFFCTAEPTSSEPWPQPAGPVPPRRRGRTRCHRP